MSLPNLGKLCICDANPVAFTRPSSATGVVVKLPSNAQERAAAKATLVKEHAALTANFNNEDYEDSIWHDRCLYCLVPLIQEQDDQEEEEEQAQESPPEPPAPLGRAVVVCDNGHVLHLECYNAYHVQPKGDLCPVCRDNTPIYNPPHYIPRVATEDFQPVPTALLSQRPGAVAAEQFTTQEEEDEDDEMLAWLSEDEDEDAVDSDMDEIQEQMRQAIVAPPETNVVTFSRNALDWLVNRVDDSGHALRDEDGRFYINTLLPFIVRDAWREEGFENRRVTLLHLAVHKGDGSLLSWLFEHPWLDVNAVDEKYATPLFTAIDLNNQDATRMIIGHADVNLDDLMDWNNEWIEPVLYAAYRRNWEIATMIVEKNALLGVSREDWRQPDTHTSLLYYAIEDGSSPTRDDFLRSLINAANAGRTILFRDTYRFDGLEKASLLMMAIVKRDRVAVEALLEIEKSNNFQVTTHSATPIDSNERANRVYRLPAQLKWDTLAVAYHEERNNRTNFEDNDSFTLKVLTSIREEFVEVDTLVYLMAKYDMGQHRGVFPDWVKRMIDIIAEEQWLSAKVGFALICNKPWKRWTLGEDDLATGVKELQAKYLVTKLVHKRWIVPDADGDYMDALMSPIFSAIKTKNKWLFNVLTEDTTRGDFDINQKYNYERFQGFGGPIRTVLMQAAIQGEPDTVERLLEYPSIDVNLALSHGHTAMHFLAMVMLGPGQTSEQLVAIAKMLVRRGADIDARMSTGLTPLLFAMYHGNLGLVGGLILMGADHTITDDSGDDVLWYAQHNRKQTDDLSYVNSYIRIAEGKKKARLGP